MNSVMSTSTPISTQEDTTLGPSFLQIPQHIHPHIGYLGMLYRHHVVNNLCIYISFKTLLMFEFVSTLSKFMKHSLTLTN